jgi:hypothetical protein
MKHPKITSEDFFKLKQLDRIEFRQRMSIISKRTFVSSKISIFFSLIYFLCSLFCFAMAFLGAPHYGDDWFYHFFNLAVLSRNWAIIFFIIFVGTSFIEFYLSQKIKKAIEKEYFPNKFKQVK